MHDIYEKLGGWPVVKGDSWDEENWSWIKTVQMYRKLGFSMDYILDLSVETDSKNSSKRTLDVSYSNNDPKVGTMIDFKKFILD